MLKSMFPNFNDLINALKRLATVEPKDDFEFLNLERSLFDISEFIRTQIMEIPARIIFGII